MKINILTGAYIEKWPSFTLVEAVACGEKDPPFRHGLQPRGVEALLRRTQGCSRRIRLRLFLCRHPIRHPFPARLAAGPHNSLTSFFPPRSFAFYDAAVAGRVFWCRAPMRGASFSMTAPTSSSSSSPPNPSPSSGRLVGQRQQKPLILILTTLAAI